MRKIVIILIGLIVVSVLKGSIGAKEAKKVKILVAYYSKTGNTKRVANDIAKALGADVEEIIDKKKRSGIFGFIFAGRDAMKERKTEIAEIKYDPEKYDMVIIGTPVWAWRMTPAVRTYIDNNKEKFKKIALFCTAGSTKAEEIIPPMEELAGKKAIAYTGFVENELKNKEVYKKKIKEFIDKLKL